MEACGSEFVIDVSSKRLGSLRGEGLARCPKLRSLNAAFNGLERCDGLDAVPDLRDAQLHNNRIASMEGLQVCKRLERLQLQNNALRAISALQEAKFLRHLRLDRNAIEAVEGLDKCFSLEELDVSGNRLARLGVLRCRALHTLRASDNAISEVAAGDLAGVPALEELHLDSNRITAAPGLAPLSSLLVRVLRG